MNFESLSQKLRYLIEAKGDISEHLLTLVQYSQQCETILELGVRGVVSSWAFLYGLLLNNKSKKCLYLNDITECDIRELQSAAQTFQVNIKYAWCNDLELAFTPDDKIELVFIDTWHVYGQLKRELAKFGKIAQKYIILHDTTVDEYVGESIRMGKNIEEDCLKNKMTYSEVIVGLWPAVVEFLKENPQWVLRERFKNNNGLTVLEKKAN